MSGFRLLELFMLRIFGARAKIFDFREFCIRVLVARFRDHGGCAWGFGL